MDTQYGLYHSGIKGQKWGVRLYQNPDGSLTPLGRIRYAKQQKTRRKNLEKARIAKASKVSKKDDSDISDDYREAHTKKNIKSMSDAELKKRLNRIQMEDNYAKLKRQDINTGKRYVQGFIKTAGTVATIMTTAINLYNNSNTIKDIVNKTMKKG